MSELSATLEDLLAAATARAPMKTADSKSAAVFERVEIGGQRYVLKVVDGRTDWVAIASRDTTARAVNLWEDGVYELMPSSIDHAVVAGGRLVEGGRWPAALLMTDVTDFLVPEDAVVDVATHAAFIGAMADLAVRFRHQPPVTTYMPFEVNYHMLSPAESRRQLLAGTAGGPQPFVEPGWEAIRRDAPALHGLVAGLLDDPSPLVDALLATPTTFLQGDWKMGNMGIRPDGRTVLLDWDRPAVGPPTADLAWYVAVNCDRLPESKDDTLTRFREALEARGWPTADWWDRQVTLALLGAFLQLGWSKAGQDAELAWWEPVVTRASSMLGA